MLLPRWCCSIHNNLEYDKQTGEILKLEITTLNMKKIEDEEKSDGYYSILLTSLI